MADCHIVDRMMTSYQTTLLPPHPLCLPLLKSLGSMQGNRVCCCLEPMPTCGGLLGVLLEPLDEELESELTEVLAIL